MQKKLDVKMKPPELFDGTNYKYWRNKLLGYLEANVANLVDDQKRVLLIVSLMSSKGLVGNFVNNFYEHCANGGVITWARLLNEIEDTFGDKNED